MTITIPDELVEQAHLSANELRADLAAYLYERGRLTIGQARKLANLDLISFQHELAKRDIHIQLGVDDFDKDLKNLNLL
jgi:predicted HTH domain antitoxin